MTDERRFEELWVELQRIGVDPYSFPAGLTLSREEAIRVAATLPEGAGPAAFLSAIREEQQRMRFEAEGRDTVARDDGVVAG